MFFSCPLCKSDNIIARLKWVCGSEDDGSDAFFEAIEPLSSVLNQHYYRVVESWCGNCRIVIKQPTEE